MNVGRFRSRLALSIVAATGPAVILALALAGGPQRLAGGPARAVAGQCGISYGGQLEVWDPAVVTLVPGSGPAGSPFEVGLSGILSNDYGDQPVEVLWNWNPETLGGDLIGSGIVPRDEPATLLGAMVPVSAEPGEHTVTACWWHSLNETWYYKEAPFEVTDLTPTPTPTVPPGASQMRNCPQAGRWALAAWGGPDGVDAGEALAACGEGAVDAAYALDPSTGEWLGWFRDRPELSKLSTVESMQGLITLGSSTASPIPTVEPALPEPGQMRGCPLPGRWAMAVWDGPDGTEAGAALDTCGVWQADVAYWLNPETGGWERWFRDRPELSTFPKLAFLGTVIVPGVGKTSDLIAFTSDRDGKREIYVMQPDTLVQTRITHDSAGEREIAWSPDHLKIAFLSSRYGGWDMMVMNANGTMQGLMFPDPATGGSEAAWSPDGIRLAFVSRRDGNPEIYMMNADGIQTRLTYNDLATDYDHPYLDWDVEPAWSPDGTKIAFSSWRDGNSEIYVMNANGTWQVNVTHNGAWDDEPAWSPDGTKIAFTSNRDGDHEIYVMNADGTGQHNLTNIGWEDSQPTWSLDGARIAFTSNRGGNDNIHWMNADGTGQVRLTTNQSGDYGPAWSPW